MYRYIYCMQNAQPVPHFTIYIEKMGSSLLDFRDFYAIHLHTLMCMCMNMQQFSCSSSGNAVCCCQCCSRVNWIFCVTLVILSSIMLTRDPLRTIKGNLNIFWLYQKHAECAASCENFAIPPILCAQLLLRQREKKLCARCPRFWPVKIRYGRFCLLIRLIPSVWLLIT